MSPAAQPRRIAFIGTYLPRQCGIATFTHDLCQAVAGQYAGVECFVVPVNDLAEGYEYPEEARFELVEQDLESYERAADFLNFSDTEVVCLQHEFGIFGGPAGGHILTLLRELQIPVVTTLHTVLEGPGADQRRVLQEVARLSSRVVVMTERALRMLREIYRVPKEKVDLIPHGIPDMPFVDPNFFKDQFGVEGKTVVLTFGLISPGKGIEYVIRALPEVVRFCPDLVYIILGATHPNLLREQGETYRLSLERLASDLNVKKHVVFYNRFVELEKLKEFLGVADVYVTPYLNPGQIVSGTLSYAFGCGKAVISTPYWHAEELLADGRGVLVPFRDSEAIGRELIALLRDEVNRHAMRKRAYLMGREMTWSQVAHQYVASFHKARQSRMGRAIKRYSIKTLEQDRLTLPALQIDHLKRLSDHAGILQHATFSLPNYHEGYCTDDNARALLLTVLLEETGDDTLEAQCLSSAYAAFLNYAFDPERKSFRNFMSFDRRWQEVAGSDDAQGRALWALGACVGRSRRRSLQMWASQLFNRAMSAIADSGSVRAWAFGLVGISEYLKRMSGDRHVDQLRGMLTQRLLDGFRQHGSDDWPWFEPGLTYANATLPHALLVGGRLANQPEALEIGLRSLRWLLQAQTAEAGHFRPIGSNGFYPRDGQRAKFDQQPIEAGATVSACLQAFQCAQDKFWLNEARRAFEWFVGRNDLGQSLYDAATGGCYDALHVDRVNLNQGAESTLAFLLALQEMRLAEMVTEAYTGLVEAETIA
ncbi:MAG TPA: glycosyltransferase family 4 protein [Haliangiales bacterium]|nr:glycosyltransferase family 4 protein [Haliangiales bacterium]